MRSRTLLLAALGLPLVGLALVVPRREPELFPAATLQALLRRPLAGPNAGPNPPSFFQALLAHSSLTRDARGATLRLRRVLADPSAARLSAQHAGELLSLEAHTPTGPLGIPLWQAVLEHARPAEDGGLALELYGCRHLADADAGPTLEDTYAARLALADALAQHARTRAGAPPLELRGREVPVRGGINLEVELVGQTQAVRVTFDGAPEKMLRAQRVWRPTAPNDARARADLVAALRTEARAHGIDELAVEGEHEPVADGLDVRLERAGERVSLVATHAGKERLATWLEASADAQAQH
jgi:hypothetical protein